MKTIRHRKTFLTAVFCIISAFVNCQSYYFRVYFKDKGNNTSGYTASDLLSERAIARRIKSGISFPDYRDTPVNSNYLQQITSRGFKLHCKSKWMNTALYTSDNSEGANILLTLPFVAGVKKVKDTGTESKSGRKLDFETVQAGPAAFDLPLQMLKGDTLHNLGFKGKNMLIAVLDGGFSDADKIESLQDLKKRNGVSCTYDFVQNDNYVYESSTHGTAVLSVLAGSLPGYIAGTAPEADYILLKTEDVISEFPCEEDFWAAGAEFADSAGVDIISSSVGYNIFTEPSMNYSQTDLDGNTAFITKVADIAASKGIVVFTSAGNERTHVWRKIIFPSDGDSVASVGAVDANRIISNFSSEGPSSDGRIKPDFVAMGVAIPVQSVQGIVNNANGTSFSCPVISGLAACLMQAVPTADHSEIISSIQKASDRYRNPDQLYGNGIPDFGKALLILQDKYIPVFDEDVIVAPNPFTESFDILFNKTPGTTQVELYSVSGKLLTKSIYTGFTGRSLHFNNLQNMEQGLYILRIISEEATWVKRIIKISY